VLTQYGIQKPVQRLLAAIRTDLDSFTELEAYALMVSGYRQAQLQLAELPAEAAAKPVTRQWRFLDVEKHLAPGPTYEEALRQLRIGGQTALKVWRQSRLLTAGGLAVLAAATLRLAWVLWVNLDREVPLTLPVYTVRALVLAALVVLAGRVAPHVVALIRYRETLRGLGMKSLAAAVLALVFKLHLLVFDPLFLKLGRLERLDRKFPRS
jgi:hypothetical protein